MKNKRTQQIADALRSGQYRQGRSMLGQAVRPNPNGPIKVLHCCMGVMCELTPGVEKDEVQHLVDQFVSEMLDDRDDWTEKDVIVSEEDVPLHYDGNHEMPPVRVHAWIGLSIEGLGSSEALYLDSGDVTVQEFSGRVESLLNSISLDTFNDTWQFTFDQIGDLIAYFGLTNEVSRD